MIADKRGEARHAPAALRQDGMSLNIGGRRIPVRMVHNISGRGVSLCLDERLAAGTPVAVECMSGEEAVRVNGVVRWSSVNANALGGRYSAGIGLLAPHLLLAFMLEPRRVVDLVGVC